MFKSGDDVLIIKSLWEGVDVAKARFAEAPEEAPHLCGLNELDSKGKKFRDFVAVYNGRDVIHDTPDNRELLQEISNSFRMIDAERKVQYGRMKAISADSSVSKETFKAGDPVLWVGDLTLRVCKQHGVFVGVGSSEGWKEIEPICEFAAEVEVRGHKETTYANFVIHDTPENLALLHDIHAEDQKITERTAAQFQRIYAISADRRYNKG